MQPRFPLLLANRRVYIHQSVPSHTAKTGQVRDSFRTVVIRIRKQNDPESAQNPGGSTVIFLISASEFLVHPATTRRMPKQFKFCPHHKLKWDPTPY